MSTAIITIEDVGDEVKINIDFGEGGGQETSPAHMLAVRAVQMVTRSVGASMDTGEVG